MENKLSNGSSDRMAARRHLLEALIVIGGLLAILIWSYWRVISGLLRDWRTDANYSVGQLVPLIVIYLVWHDRRNLRNCTISPCWWGALIVLLGLFIRERGLVWFYESGERAGLLITIFGLVLWVGGSALTWRLRWILAMLMLMIPLPGRLHNLISGPLQGFATMSTVVLLETLGVNVSREGNTLVLNNSVTVAVAEACGGLRMLTAFVVVAATFAHLVARPAWQRVVLVASSLPIAIFCNIARLFATAMLYLFVNDSTAGTFFHDFAGVTMMPLAIALLVGELRLLSMLVIPDGPAPALRRSDCKAPGAPARARRATKDA